MTHRQPVSKRLLAKALRGAALFSLALSTACGSNDESDGPGDRNSSSQCALAITLSGDYAFTSDLDDAMGCGTAYSTMPGAYAAFTPEKDRGLVVRLAFPDLMPNQPATSTPETVRIDLAEGTQFSPMGCTGDITRNTLHDSSPDGDVYLVGGEGRCTEPGVNGAETVSVVGTFRFVSLIRWQN